MLRFEQLMSSGLWSNIARCASQLTGWTAILLWTCVPPVQDDYVNKGLAASAYRLIHYGTKQVVATCSVKASTHYATCIQNMASPASPASPNPGCNKLPDKGAWGLQQGQS